MGSNPAATWSATVGDERRWARASVVRSTSAVAPSARTTTAMVWPGSARSKVSASTRPAWAVPVLPTDRARSSATRPRRRPWRTPWPLDRAARPPPARRRRRGTARPASSASPKAASARGTYTCSPNRSSHTCEAGSPGSRHRSRNSRVVEALGQHLGQHRAVAAEQRRRRRRRRRHARRPRRAGRCGCRTARPGSAWWCRPPAPVHRRRSGPNPPRRRPGWRRPGSSAAWTMLALVLSR